MFVYDIIYLYYVVENKFRFDFKMVKT